MERYCSCNRGIGFSNRTSVVQDARGVEICSHCGGIVPPEDSNSLEDENDYVDLYAYNYRQAKACSIKGNHSNAIKFYKKVLRLSGSVNNCEVLSAIADEYEAMGDYGSAEDYWLRCCEVERHDSYMYIARKGDFLYRRDRHEEAIDAYEEVLKELNGIGDRNFSLAMLKYYARVVHFIIISYNNLAKNNLKEKYHRQLKHAINRFLHSRWAKCDETDAHYLSKIAWEIYEEDRMTDEALILIDTAIELHPNDEYYNRKAIFIKHQLEIRVLFKNIKHHDLDLINEAIKILPDDCDSSPYLKVKGDILNQLGDPVNARICHALAAKDYDKVDEAEKKLKSLKSTATYINITGIHYYQHFAPFREGTVVDLIKEPDNQHDQNAIRVEIDGKTVGYVANNKYTLIKEVKSATDIKNNKSSQAKVQFILFDEWVIAKLI